jgi:peptidoglycan hydrolase-like protein with peptidoglycan-binding domain
MGIWVENDAHVPKPGDIMMYDWDDSGYGENKNNPEHVGVVEKISGNTITVIEGNKHEAVGRRYIEVNGKYIRGYIVPKYDAEEEVEPVAPVTTYTFTQFVKDVQAACGAAVDGVAGTETISKTVTLSRYWNRRHKAVKAVQKRLYALGYTEVGEADGVAGPKFTLAVKAFQRDNDCIVDGEITKKNKTWKKLLGML